MTASPELQPPRTRRPRLTFAFSALVLLIGVLGLALYTPSRGPQQRLPPGIRLKPPGVDLGLLYPASTGRGTFRITNDGPMSYRVDRVTPECGCMVVAVKDRLLPPGSRLDIPVTVKGSGWGDGLRTKHVAAELVDDTGARSVVLLPVTAAVRESMNLAVIPGHVELPVSTFNDILTFSLFARGDKAIIDRLPARIDFEASPVRQVELRSPPLEGRNASRELVVTLRPTRAINQPGETRILQIVIEGKETQTIEVPVHINASH